MSPRVIPILVLGALLGALAAGARADERKVYRWVGEDGRVYTSNTPPPGGKGLIDAPPAKPAPKPAAAAPRSVAVPRWILAPAEDPRSLPAAPAPDADSCSRWGGVVAQWRDAQQSVASWEATIERLESRTDNFIRRDDTAYHASLDRANQHLDDARARADRIESEGRRDGMPQSCLTE